MPSTAHKRTPGEVKEDRKRIARLYVRGKTHQEITDAVNADKPEAKKVSRQQITNDIKAIVREWQTSALTDMDKVLSVQLQRIAWIEEQAEIAWEKSQQDATERQQGGTQEGEALLDKAGAPQFDKAGVVIRKNAKTTYQLKQKGQTGNAHYLTVMLECVKERNRIFGLYTPVQLEINDLNKAIDAEFQRLHRTNNNGNVLPPVTTSEEIN